MQSQQLAASVSLVVLHCSVVLAAPTVWSSDTGGNGHAYEFVTDRVDWSTALAAAPTHTHLGAPGYLATVTSAGENDFIRQLIANAPWAAWLSGSDRNVEGAWIWEAGPEIGQTIGPYTAWPVTEPNNLNNEDALAIWGPNGANGIASWGEWNDFQASDTHGYVVEYGVPIPEPAAAAAAIAVLGLLTLLRLRPVA